MSAHVEVVEARLFESIVADEIVAVIQDVLSEHPFCSIALAGGSTPGGVYRALARPPRVDAVDWPRVKLFMGDERWVPLDDTQSNFRMVKETMLDHIPDQGPQAFPVDTAHSSAQASAKHYADTLAQELPRGRGGMPHLNLVLLGIGGDGHTASLFPGNPLVTNSAVVVAATKDAAGQQDRITLGRSVICGADKIFFIVKGHEKAEVVKEIISGDAPDTVLPARIYVEAEGEVTFFVDSGAGQLLARDQS